jgi:hypothetical protein
MARPTGIQGCDQPGRCRQYATEGLRLQHRSRLPPSPSGCAPDRSAKLSLRLWQPACPARSSGHPHLQPRWALRRARILYTTSLTLDQTCAKMWWPTSRPALQTYSSCCGGLHPFLGQRWKPGDGCMTAGPTWGGIPHGPVVFISALVHGVVSWGASQGGAE